MNLTEYKQKYGVSALRELAGKIGTSYPYLYQMETGRRAVTPEMACELEVATNGVIKRVSLRPDVFGPLLPQHHQSVVADNSSANEAA